MEHIGSTNQIALEFVPTNQSICLPITFEEKCFFNKMGKLLGLPFVNLNLQIHIFLLVVQTDNNFFAIKGSKKLW